MPYLEPNKPIPAFGLCDLGSLEYIYQGICEAHWSKAWNSVDDGRSYLKQRLSSSIQRDRGTLGTEEGLQEIFYILRKK